MTSRGLLVIVGAGVGIVAVVAVFAWPAGEPTARRERAEAAGSARELGVRAEAVDTARRTAAADEAAAPVVLPEVRPELGVDEDPRRGEPPAPPEPPVPPSAAAMAESAASLAAQPKVLEAVEGALEDRRVAIRRSCWGGNVPAAASFPVEASYSAEGAMLSLSVGDSREAPGVGTCIRSQGLIIPQTIDAPGVGVTVRSALTLP